MFRRRAMSTALPLTSTATPNKDSKTPTWSWKSKYTTQVQTHSALETHGLVADWKPDLLTVWASTQGTASVREELADYFKIPKSQVRVITEYVGGGFGAKFGAGNPGSGRGRFSRSKPALRCG